MATTLLDNTITFILDTWPELASQLSDDRIAGWAEEIASGTGRSEAEIRNDIFNVVVTRERVAEWARAQFADRGLELATGNETAGERIGRIVDELMAGETKFNELSTTLDKYGTVTETVTPGATGQPGTTDETAGHEPDDADKHGTVDVGGTVIPSGMRLVKVKNPSGTDASAIFYLVGSVFGVEVAYEVGDAERLNDLYGGAGSFDNVTTVNQGQFNNSGILIVGDVDEINGTSESLQAQYERDMREAGLESPPEWMVSSPEAMAIYVTGINEGWSPERTWNALADTEAFQERFPGLSTIRSQLGTSQIGLAIQEYLGREDAIKAALLKYRGPNTDTASATVSELVASGWQGGEVTELLELEAEVRGNQAAFDNINDILAFQGLPELSPDDFTNLIRDYANVDDPVYQPSDIFESVNDALRQTALQSAGLEVSDELATELGSGTSFSIESPDKFNDQAQYVAGIVAANANELDLGSYGLDRDQVLKFFLGDSEDPDVGQKLEKLGRERNIAAQGFAQSTAFVNKEGRLITQGFSNI